MADEPGTSQQKSGKARKNTKRTGEFSEAAFLTKATGMGFKVAKPWGDSERYDFIVACPAEDSPEFFWRVQVKCTEITRARAYEVRAAYTVGKSRAVYTPDDIDFLVAHVVPRDIWYVLPVEACMPSPMLRFYPDGARCTRFEQYREAWHLLRERPRGFRPQRTNSRPRR
jgi:PD-(D/E)XK endonuclease